MRRLADTRVGILQRIKAPILGDLITVQTNRIENRYQCANAPTPACNDGPEQCHAGQPLGALAYRLQRRGQANLFPFNYLQHAKGQSL